jgi:hypothetical protein
VLDSEVTWPYWGKSGFALQVTASPKQIGHTITLDDGTTKSERVGKEAMREDKLPNQESNEVERDRDVSLATRLRQPVDVQMPDTKVRGWALGCALAAVVVLITLTTQELWDDSAILQRYAINLANGSGWSFNPNAQTDNAVSSPLMVLILAAFHIVGIPVTLASTILFASGMWAASFFVYLSLRQMEHEVGGAFAAVLVATSPLLASFRGMESALLLALISLTIYFAQHEWILPLGIAAGLAVLARPDTVIVLTPLLFLMAMRLRRRMAPALIATAAIVLAWMIASWGVLGSPLPSTLAAKVAQAESGMWPGFVTGAVRASHVAIVDALVLSWLVMIAAVALVVRRQTMTVVVLFAVVWFVMPVALDSPSVFLQPTRSWMLLPLVMLGIIFVLYQKLDLLSAILLGVLGLMAFLTIANVAFYPWYSAVPAFFGLIMAGVGSEGLIRFVGKRSQLITSALVTLYLLLAVLIAWPNSETHSPSADRAEYPMIAEWLKSNTSPEATVAASEFGKLGLLSDREMVDFLGLLDSEAIPYVAKGDWNWWVGAYEPDYIVMGKGWSETFLPIDQSWFGERYEPVLETPHHMIFARKEATTL